VGYTSTGSTGTLTFTPAADASGTATVTVTVSDGSATTTQTFTVTVTPVNDAPSFTPGADQTVVAGAGSQAVTGWATGISRGPANESGQGLTFVVTTTNPGLFVALPAIDPETGALTFIPEASATGTATVTVVLRDDGGTANNGADTSAVRTFTIAVNPNGLPTTPGVRMVGSELIITGADTADTVTVTQQGSDRVKVNAILNGRKYNNQSFSGVTRVRVDVDGGNDTINLSGVTTLPTWTDAGTGDDTVTGGGGADQIYLGAGEDVADGGAGNDLIVGGDDDDFVIGGPGVDQLFGQAGNDILVGGSAAVRNTNSDSLRKVLTDWNPASTGTGGYTDIRGRLNVTDDGAADELTGGTGTDWFWGVSVVLTDRDPAEQRN
jgi:Ca2+-binding RTX toxin-like protein